MKNVRTEFIYYNTETDPVTEFGIRGNYPMRTLSTHCSEMHEYLAALKKAVSRNSIIVVIGGYGADGEIADVTGRAVGLQTVPFDYAALGFGHPKGAPERLPSGCLPMIDASGEFVGILLESMPQAIFLLSENSSDRPYVAHELIAPYVFEFYNTVIKGEADD